MNSKRSLQSRKRSLQGFFRGKEFKRFWYTRIDGVHTGGEVVVLGVLVVAAVIWVVFTSYAG